MAQTVPNWLKLPQSDSNQLELVDIASNYMKIVQKWLKPVENLFEFALSG